MAFASKRSRIRSLQAAAVLAVLALGVGRTHALPRTWIGGNVDWVDGVGNNANWNPADEPDVDDEAIFNTANTVNLGTANTIQALTMSAGIDLDTNDFDLTVVGLVQLVDASTNLNVGGAASTLSAHNVTINNAADLQMAGGVLDVGGVPAAGFGVLDVNAGGELLGHGTVNLTEGLNASETLLVNDGAISAISTPFIIFGEPPVGTLSINATDTDARIDLDGVGENGVLNVFRNQTLDVNVQTSESFDGDLNLFQNSTFDRALNWTLASGTIDVDNGFIDGVFPNPDVPAGVSIIDGGTLTQTGGTITVIDADGTLRFNTNFTMNGGTFTNNGLVIFDGNATLAAAANFVMTDGSDVTVEANRTVTVNQTNFNMDGIGVASNSNITVNGGGQLNFNVGDYDTDAVTNSYDGVITLNSGDLDVFTADAEFVMDGTLNFNSTTDIAEWTGEPLDIGNDTGSLDADLNITGTNISRIVSQIDFNSDADVSITAGAELQLTGAVNFLTVNGANNAEFTGAGEIAFSGPINVLEAVTLNMVSGTVDLDGSDGFGDTHNIDAPLAINAATMESYGRNNDGGGIDTLDVNNTVGTGVLTVNLDNPIDEWTLNAPGVMNLVNDNAPATLLAGSDVNVNGTLNVTGDVRTTARLDVAGIVNINTAAEPFRLAGGANNDSNRIEGGTINGPGILGADANRNLVGFGTINANIDFDGLSDLLADDGQLIVNGAILDVAVIGSANSSGILNVTGPWNTNVAVTVVNQFGGEIRGGTITVDNANGIRGTGLVAARVINNTRIVAAGFFVGQPPGTHVFQTAANDSDWDGSANAGTLAAVEGHTLELRDTATFGFTGTVQAIDGSRVFTSGYALDFNPGSTIQLTNGTYESTHSTDVGGTVTINAGAASTIVVENNRFLTFETGSTTTLNGNLQLLNNNINIEAGAMFSGAGALIVPDGSHIVADNLANVGVLLDMQGAFRPGNSEGIGRIDLFDYQQANTSELFVELTGTSLNAFNRLVASGDVVLDGYLNIDIDLGFVPALGNTFNIITGNTVTGAFDYADVSGMPAGLAFHIEYLANAVQLQVVNEPFFSADFDDDGDVDATDLAIWRGAFNLNQLGDADGDNDSDGNDFLMWQQQLGSAPSIAAAAAVPEPTGSVLAFCSLLGLWLNCRAVGKSSVTNHAADRRQRLKTARWPRRFGVPARGQVD